jgi:hypothetical protein
MRADISVTWNRRTGLYYVHSDATRLLSVARSQHEALAKAISIAHKLGPAKLRVQKSGSSLALEWFLERGCSTFRTLHEVELLEKRDGRRR